MAYCNWAHLCDYAFYDDGKKICIIGIFDAITVQRVPTTHTRAVLAMEIKGEPGETVEGRIQVLRPDHGELLDTGGPIQLSPAGHAQLVLGIDNLTLPDIGPYEIRILLDGEVAKVVPFQVIRASR